MVVIGLVVSSGIGCIVVVVVVVVGSGWVNIVEVVGVEVVDVVTVVVVVVGSVTGYKNSNFKTISFKTEFNLCTYWTSIITNINIIDA